MSVFFLEKSIVFQVVGFTGILVNVGQCCESHGFFEQSGVKCMKKYWFHMYLVKVCQFL